MKAQHSSASAEAPRRRRNGLAWFVGSLTLVVLLVGIGGNVMFNNMNSTSAPQSARAKAVAPVQPVANMNHRDVQPPAEANSQDLAPEPATLSGGAPQQPQSAAMAMQMASPQSKGVPSGAFTPPSEMKLPEGKFGEVVRLGEQIFLNTGKHAARYVGNDLSCANCHLDAGRKSHSAPMWAAFTRYPAYRGKTGAVDTLAARIQGCFIYSMNGKAPPQDDAVITALQTYFFWLAKGAPVGTPMEGAGYPALQPAAMAADRSRGAVVYTENCAFCHGKNGQGQRSAGTQVFPPLWGPRSFNWGAGMHRIATAAAFIHANMPLGKGGSLSEQQAWDVAQFMNSHERPQDPRYTGSVESTRTQFHEKDDSLYGQKIDGKVLGSPL